MSEQPSMKPIRKVGRGSVNGGTASGAITAFLMFGAARYYGGSELVPRDVLEVMPWAVWAITALSGFFGGYFTKSNPGEPQA